ncbi:amidohydrolase family protein [Paenibacillus eucommiae]|uniref:TIM-barrel fold metal-dependent hydrolase n=1 Tax=Paenibacillus eucommiae TaxID=1355755 RepID=A0ABS4IXM6_9BACL|nr:amidohydrolase family protein [Paenibacillus eucommiae]MBP1992263.1 putative TIM-barrel fold metal-dependent hydrolase [Paenibacillus eucommiae]
MKKIDINHMIGDWVGADLDSLNELQVQQELDYYRIDKIVAYHAMARSYNPISGNERLLKLARSDGFENIIPCLILSPHYKYAVGWNALEELLLEEKIRFAKLCPKEHGYYLHSKHTHELFQIASKLNIHLLIDYEDIIDAAGTELPEFENLLQTFPTVNVIVTAFRHRRNMVIYTYMERFPNFYTELSLFDNWLAYEELVKRFGSDRLLWGSNMPFNKPGSAISMLSYADISKSDKEKIAFGNLELLLQGGV